MKVTFIQPSTFSGKPYDSMQPLVFAILKALMPSEVETTFFDERIEPVPENLETDAVVLSIATFSAQRAYQISGKFRARGIPVIAGGFHPTLCPEEAALFVDCIVTGDAEDTWPRVIEDLKQNRLQKRYNSKFPPISSLAPDRSLFAKKKYVPVLPVQFGRGCPFDCDFCSIHAFYGSSLRHRPPENIEAELSALPNAHIFFTDDNLMQHRGVFNELLLHLKNARRRWSCQISLDVASQPELLRNMAEAGCTSVTIGFESLDVTNLRQMGKTVNEQYADYGRMIKNLNTHGIMVYGCFVFGYDSDTPDVFKRTLDFALGHNLFLANFIPLTPLPGTALYTRLKNENRLIKDPWWLDPMYRYGQTTFFPRGMSPDELEGGVRFIRHEFNRYHNIAKRAVRNQSHRKTAYNAAVYLASNIASRREIKRKQASLLHYTCDPFMEVPAV